MLDSTQLTVLYQTQFCLILHIQYIHVLMLRQPGTSTNMKVPENHSYTRHISSRGGQIDWHVWSAAYSSWAGVLKYASGKQDTALPETLMSNTVH